MQSSLIASISASELLPRTDSTCGPTIITSARVITFEDIISLTHSCYSYTTNTPKVSDCPTRPNCITSTTSTLYFPSDESCCAFTPTVTSQGPCSTCQTGCSTVVRTNTVTTTPPPAPPTLPLMPTPLPTMTGPRLCIWERIASSTMHH
ncbi:hypothetical protein BJ878DRAFT_276099 [Calycina marina]|uniref:Uncharacterized protein n=1 Tax=Calycina marina TaxID=1763456 RepID=A0A9P7Z790_9HELO|nr:hypothetical protein BJ878DRAFT_276099 [Calycina marina]